MTSTLTLPAGSRASPDGSPAPPAGPRSRPACHQRRRGERRRSPAVSPLPPGGPDRGSVGGGCRHRATPARRDAIRPRLALGRPEPPKRLILGLRQPLILLEQTAGNDGTTDRRGSRSSSRAKTDRRPRTMIWRPSERRAASTTPDRPSIRAGSNSTPAPDPRTPARAVGAQTVFKTPIFKSSRLASNRCDRMARTEAWASGHLTGWAEGRSVPDRIGLSSRTALRRRPCPASGSFTRAAPLRQTHGQSGAGVSWCGGG